MSGRRSRIWRIVLVVALLCLIVALPAYPKHRSGRYKGPVLLTGADVSFTVSGGRVRAVTVTSLAAGCSDRARPFRITPSIKKIEAAVSRDKFVYSEANTAETFVFGGKLSGKSGSGQMRDKAKLNAQGQPDPNGTIVCDTGWLSWRAKRR